MFSVYTKRSSLYTPPSRPCAVQGPYLRGTSFKALSELKQGVGILITFADLRRYAPLGLITKTYLVPSCRSTETVSTFWPLKQPKGWYHGFKRIGTLLDGKQMSPCMGIVSKIVLQDTITLYSPEFTTLNHEDGMEPESRQPW